MEAWIAERDHHPVEKGSAGWIDCNNKIPPLSVALSLLSEIIQKIYAEGHTTHISLCFIANILLPNLILQLNHSLNRSLAS